MLEFERGGTLFTYRKTDCGMHNSLIWWATCKKPHMQRLYLNLTYLTDSLPPPLQWSESGDVSIIKTNFIKWRKLVTFHGVI